ncbi:MAG TPA: SusC/RagA family TonB-linked outer membrane protein [Puia sp.]|jgi:TonB-linked SusC/RagA family outer membrane protein|nr:SusC/RagA family TonB-linked outer membrane protein [Puia sp.]
MRKMLMLIPLVVLNMVFVFAQTKEITGTIADPKGTPIPGASIKLRGSKGGTATDANGVFHINASPGAVLIISAVGMETQEVRVGASPTVAISLKQTDASLSEVVVTALGVRRDKRMLAYSTQEVTGTALVEAKQDNLLNALDGKVAGVQITNSSGMPGSSSRIVVRGTSSLLGDNTALFVIDGVPMDNTEQGNPDGSLGAGGTSNRAIDIDPNIIESITVLKGAAATALYGSSGSKGAILITTKNGQNGNRSGKPTVAFSSSYSIQKANLPELQDKYGQGVGGVYTNGNIFGQQNSYSWGPKVDTLKVNGAPVKVYNPLKMYFVTGHTTDNNVSVSGFGDRSSYVASYSYLRTDGTEPTTNYIRNSFFTKYVTALGTKLSLSTQFNYIHSDNNRLEEGNGLAAPLWTVLAAPITWNPFPTINPDGTQRLYRSAARNNPYWLLDNTGLADKVDRLIPVVSLAYNPLSWLSFTERLGGDMYNEQLDFHENTGVVEGNSAYESGRVYSQTNRFQNFNHDFIVHAKKEFGSDWFVDLLVGNNVLTNYHNKNFVQGVGLSIPGLYRMGNATNVSSSYNSYEKRKVGFYAQASAEYKKMLTLTVTGRYDGTSVLSEGHQYYPYGSASLGFIFTEPLKMSDSRILNFGKVRVAYSKVGDDAIDPYSLTNPYYQANLVGNVQFPFNGQNGYVLTTNYGYPLKNESIKEFETGIETHWFNNRATLDVTYYDKKSSNLLTSGVPLAGSTGYESATLNAGNMENKGVEVQLGITPVKTRNFTWHVDLNWTKNSNKVLALAPGINFLQFAGFIDPGIFAFANSPYGTIYGTHFLRNSKGQMLIGDDGYGINEGDLQPIGNVTPKWIGGLVNTVSYKAFTFSFVLDMKHGGQMINFDDHYLDSYGTSKRTENRDKTTILPGILKSSGKVNDIVIKTDQNYFQNHYSTIDETSVEDASFLKLRSVALSYNFAGNLLKGSLFKSLTLTATGTNFILHKNYTGSDPEVSLNGSGNGQGFSNFTAPTNRSFILGLRATF